MEEIIEWLINMEQMAGAVYHDASTFFKKDTKLKKLLDHLIEDEAWHYHVMVSAADFTKREKQPLRTLALDEAHKARIEAPFHKNRARITRGILTKDSLVDCIVTTEFSEWNYFFLYVINALKGKKREFEYAASTIEHHKKLIEHYIEKLPDNGNYIKKIRNIAKIWDVRILIVDYNKPFCLLMSEILSNEGVVETANTGETGLMKINEQYRDIVLLNDSMPGMNGAQFYKKAVQHDPLIADRFVFLMNKSTPSRLDFVKKNKIKYLIKPCTVSEVKEAMHDILSKTPRKSKIKHRIVGKKTDYEMS